MAVLCDLSCVGAGHIKQATGTSLLRMKWTCLVSPSRLDGERQGIMQGLTLGRRDRSALHRTRKRVNTLTHADMLIHADMC